MTKWLVVHYAPGAAGRLLICYLGTHPQIASFNQSEQSHIDWFKSTYDVELKYSFRNWTNLEPYEPWGIKKYVSSKYPRGDNIDSVAIDLPNKWIPLVWHKDYTAKFMKRYYAVNIVNDPDSLTWFHKSVWRKLFHAIKNDKGYLIYDQSHRPKDAMTIKFDNQYELQVKNLHTFIKERIINNPDNIKFRKKNRFAQGIDINLTDLSSSNPKPMLDKIVADMGLDKFDWHEAQQMWSHWQSLHDY